MIIYLKVRVKVFPMYGGIGVSAPSVYFWECRWVQNHSQTMIIYLKRLKSSKFVRVKAFPMYGGIGVSAPSLHRESIDSLILVHVACCVIVEKSLVRRTSNFGSEEEIWLHFHWPWKCS